MPKGYPKDQYPEMYGDDAKSGGNGTDEPPPSTTAKKDTAAPKKSRGKAPIDKSVEQLCTVVGLGFISAGTARNDPRYTFDGTVFLSNAERMGVAVQDLADRNPAVKRVLEQAFTAGAWGSLIAATAGIVIPIAACHQVVPQALATPFIPEGATMPTPESIQAMKEAQAAMADKMAGFGSGMG